MTIQLSSTSPAASLVDTHCHIDLYPHPIDLVRQVEHARIHTVAVTNAPSVYFHTARLAAGCRYVHPAPGLHPELVADRGHELEQLWPLLESTRFVGEIGLDYVTPDAANRRRQRRVFDAILHKCAQFGDKVLTVHSRRAAADVIAAIGKNFRGRAILHWFSGSLRDLRTAIDYGLYFSVNPAMTGSASGRRLVAEMPPERVVTETDGPFVKVDNKPATPADTGEVINELARLWHLPIEQASSIILKTFIELAELRTSV
jgi:TatD DNase family protein